MQLSEIATKELRYMLDYQQRAAQPGIATTWGFGPCGHPARGAGWCEACLIAEIERRAITARAAKRPRMERIVSSTDYTKETP